MCVRLLYTKLEGDGPERGVDEPLPLRLVFPSVRVSIAVTYVTPGWVSFNSAKGAVLIRREVDEAEKRGKLLFEDAKNISLIQGITRLKHLVVRFMWISLLRSHFFCLFLSKKLRIQSQEQGVSKLTIFRKQVQSRSIHSHTV